MVLFILFHHAPTILVLALLGLAYVTWLEVREEPISGAAKRWWCLLVFLLNVPGYLVMRVFFAVRRRRADAPLHRG